MGEHTPTPLKDLALGVAMPETIPSPLPWAISDQGYIVAECIPVRGRAVAIRAQDKRHGMQDEADANAAFIVKACNAHDALVITLKAMLVDPPSSLDEPDTDAEVIRKLRVIAREALAKVSQS